MIKTTEHGWRFYTCEKLCEGRIGINKERRAKWYPKETPINSSWLTRKEAANTLRLERNFKDTKPSFSDQKTKKLTDPA